MKELRSWSLNLEELLFGVSRLMTTFGHHVQKLRNRELRKSIITLLLFWLDVGRLALRLVLDRELMTETELLFMDLEKISVCSQIF